MNRRRAFILTALTLIVAVLGHAQESEKVPVHIKAILLDRDLNQRPVAKNKFTIISLDAQPPATIDTTTNFDGSAEAVLSPGKCRVVSAETLDFQRKRYSWNVAVSVAPPATTLEPSNDNATASESAATAALDNSVSGYREYRNSIVTVLADPPAIFRSHP